MRSTGLSVRTSNSPATSAGAALLALSSSCSLSCSATAEASASSTVSRFRLHAVGDRAQRFGVHEAREPVDHGFGHLVLARQLGQRVAGDHHAVVASRLDAVGVAA